MSPTFYYILHVSSVFLLTGIVFRAFSAPAEMKKKVMIGSGVMALLALVGGLGLLAKVHSNTFYAWVIVKLLCWLGLTGLAGMAFRMREKACLLSMIASVLVVVAVVMVYLKPWM